MLHQRVDLLGVGLFVLVDIGGEFVDSVSLTLEGNLLIDVLGLVGLWVDLLVLLELHVTFTEQGLKLGLVGKDLF